MSRETPFAILHNYDPEDENREKAPSVPGFRSFFTELSVIFSFCIHWLFTFMRRAIYVPVQIVEMK